jgi:hypothetical protein
MENVMKTTTPPNAKAGLTMVETMIVMLVGAVIVAVAAQMLVHQSVLRQAGLNSDVLDDVMRLNLAELQAHTLASTETPGFCSVRYYDKTGAYKSSEIQRYALTHPKCANALPDISLVRSQGVPIKITISILKVEDMSITFSPSQFLKLPRYVPTLLRAIELKGGYMPPNGVGTGVQRSVTIFKKAS